MHVKYVYPRLSPEKNARPLLQPELVKDLTRHMIFCVACGVVPAVPRFLLKCFATDHVFRVLFFW